jgi:uncharacterized protein
VTETTEIAASFAPHDVLAARLIAALGPQSDDGSHDLAHILRVWRSAQMIADAEPGADRELLVAAVILHDCVAVEKSAPERGTASRLSAARAREIVAGLGWRPDRLDALAHAIEAHSFSACVAPRTVEARILQDADRLDAIGAIGVARCFYTAGRMRSALYDPADPDAQRRPLDDRRFALDHFAAKLLKLADSFQTEKARAIADARTAEMQRFLAVFRDEL